MWKNILAKLFQSKTKLSLTVSGQCPSRQAYKTNLSVSQQEELILALLADRDLSANAIGEKLQLEHATVTRRLRTLRARGLIGTVGTGPDVHYSVRQEILACQHT